MLTTRDYQRKHLRAPYKEAILYVDDNFVFKGSTLNISEGGILLDQIPHFPEEGDDVPLMISLPQFPYFKNFNLEKLQSFNAEIFPKKVVRVKCSIARKMGIKSELDAVMTSRIGLRFTEVSPHAQKEISDYVNVFASNLIYLQMLIDSINTNEKNLLKIRLLATILHYPEDIKIAELYKTVLHDYKSLQWL
jgi:hypothetical protein